jgi:hypothetical protein
METQMDIPKHVVTLLVAIALLPVGAAEAEPDKVFVKGKRDTSEVVIKGVRDPSAWIRVESQHFVIYSDSDSEQVIDLANNLERLDFVLRMYLKPFLIRQTEPPKLTLYFQDRLDWPPGLGKFPVEAVGLVDGCVSGTQAFTFSQGRMWKSTNASLLKDDGDFTLSSIFALYSGNFVHRHTNIRGPIWFMWGLSVYFGGVRFTDNQMVVGRPAVATADSMKRLDYGNDNLIFLTYDDVLRTNLSRDFFGRVQRSPKPTPRILARAEFQSRSFNLAHYMLSSADHRDKMAQYLELVNNGRDGGAAFADVFGLSGFQLATTMSYYRRTQMKVIKVNFPELPAARINVTRLSRIEGEFILDNAALKDCPTSDNGKQILQRVQVAAAAARAVDFAQVTLSRAQIDWGDPRDAIPYLAGAAQREPYNDEIRYLLGMAYLKLAETASVDKRELLTAAKSSLTEAALLAPETPGISYALFRAGLMDPDMPLEKTMALAVDAWRQGHDVSIFARAAALAQAWLGNAAGAYEAFNTLSRNWNDPESAKWAVQWLKLLEQGVTQDNLLTEMRQLPPTSSGNRLIYYDLR